MLGSAYLAGDGAGQARGDACLSAVEQAPPGSRHASALHVPVEHCLVIPREQKIRAQRHRREERAGLRAQLRKAGRLRPEQMGGGSELLYREQVQVADQVDGPGEHQLQALHHVLRRLDVRRVHVGDPDAGREAVPRCEEQRGDPQAGERRKTGATKSLPPAIVLVDVAVLELRAQQTADLQGNQRNLARDSVGRKTPTAGDDETRKQESAGDVLGRRRRTAAETIQATAKHDGSISANRRGASFDVHCGAKPRSSRATSQGQSN